MHTFSTLMNGRLSTMKFHTNIITSWIDLPNYNSMIIHSLEPCNLNCYGCFNKHLPDEKESYTDSQIVDIIKLQSRTCEAVIFSGGEFLVNSFIRIFYLLKRVRREFNGIIIVNSNGTFPDKIEKLFSFGLIDGVHLDLKIPFSMTMRRANRILGITDGQIIAYKSSIKQSIEILNQSKSKFNRIRTVKYPSFTEDDLQEIQDYVKQHAPNIPYDQNEFLVLKKGDKYV